MAYYANDELWRECASWLTELELVRADHRVNWPAAVIADLANTLRDGVLLCNLLNKLDHSCIDSRDISQKPSMAQFLCLRNIDNFLKICKANFDLKESDLFEPLMLFDLTNFHKVLCTLSKLSLSSKAKLLGKSDGFSAQVEKSQEEEEIYQSLKAVKPDIREEYFRDRSNHDDDIYQDIMDIKPSLLSGGAQIESKREYVIKELIDTENNYVEVLKTIQKHYMVPLKKMLDTPQFRTIFSNIDELLQTHEGFYMQLCNVSIGDKHKISSIFMHWREKFLDYGTYCSNLTEATTLLQELCDKNDVLNQAILKYDKDANNGKFKLRDVLQVPLQRILKYHLLLDNLCKSTDHADVEYEGLVDAKDAMIDVAKFINEAARDRDLINVVTDLNKNMVWENGNSQFDLTMCGKLIKDGEIKVKEHGDNKPRTRYAFIFDKYMILCKQNKNQFVFRNKLELADFSVDDTSNRPILNQGVRWNYQWHLMKFDLSIVYTMSVRSIEIKTMMLKAIREAIDNVRPQYLGSTNHLFELVTFKRPTVCTRCSKYLKGLFFQGYSCKTCKMTVHKECINNSGRCGMPEHATPNFYVTSDIAHLQDKLWFAGEKDRSEALSLLENRKNGTFLVRIRSHDECDKFALSLKYNTVKHMKICCEDHKYFLSKSKFFNSIEELINNYMEHSLQENFDKLEEDAKLEYPYRQLRCVALRSYRSADPKHISFEEGEEVIVLNKNVNEGLWKGATRNRVGYFIKDYVQPLSETDESTSLMQSNSSI